MSKTTKVKISVKKKGGAFVTVQGRAICLQARDMRGELVTGTSDRE